MIGSPFTKTRKDCAGFTLLEVLVALMVSSIGLLGLAKMESLALSSTGVSGARALAAIEASSMAAMMRANRDYWAGASVTASAIVTQVGNAVNVSDTNLNATYNCTVAGSSSCTPVQLAAYDVQHWGAAINPLLPGYQASIACAAAVAGVSPASCTITINWTENALAINAQQSNLAALQSPSYVLYVTP